jgi:hypothetical protein
MATPTTIDQVGTGDDTDDPDDPDALDTGPHVLWGRSLRFVLVAEMMHHPEVTVAQLVAYLHDLGFVTEGRPSKSISDCLRWEIRRGRVERLGRGRYRYRSAPPSTARRIALFARRCRTWLAARLAGRIPPPLPPDPRAEPGAPAHPPTTAPWVTLGWLWVT